MSKWLAAAALIIGLIFWRSSPALAAGNINGKWHFVLDTPGGDREVDANFQQDGSGKVSGKWGKDDVSGTFSDDKLDLSFPITPEETGEKGTLKLTGKLQGDQLVGDWAFSEYNGTYKAARQKP